MNAGFGKKVGGPEGKLAAFVRGELAAGIDHQGQTGEVFVLAEPVD